jgi:hypothetical protein
MKLGQTVYLQKPDNMATGGHNKERYMKYGASKGTIVGVYKHHILVQFEHWKSSYRIVDIMLGLEPYREVEYGNM